jgi:histidinol-phosphate/aromatic aminotransferase/cobyric acid decarboxylase-like protein
MPDPARSAEDMDNALRRKGVALRRMAAPAYRDYIRISIGFEHELRHVLDLIAAFLAGRLS